MYGSMVDIQSATAEIRRGKKEEEERTRMWAGAQRDGRPAEYRWRLCSTPHVWLTPTTRIPCSNGAKTRNSLKLDGVPQTPEPISAVSGPKFAILWGHVDKILLFNNFFPIVDTCQSCKDIARQSCAMVHRWPILVLYFQRATCSTFQTCILISQ